MLTRKKRLSLSHSSPKTPVSKNCNSLSKEPLLYSPSTSACITPTRSRKGRNFPVDESPTFSQEPVSVTWKWGNDSPLARPICTKPIGSKISRPARHALASTEGHFSNNQSKPIKTDQSDDITKNSPKGLYKFQEEMRRIQEQTASNGDGEIRKDAGYPNTSSNLLLSSTMDAPIPVPVTVPEPDKKAITTDSNQILKDSTLNAIDLLNDSDFDQALLTCSEEVETEIIRDKSKEIIQQNVESPVSNTVSNSFFDNDESIDNILGSIDDDTFSIKLNNPKLLRHNSMPPQNDPVVVQNRKSFTRHESMPVSPATQLKKFARTAIPSSQGSFESMHSNFSRSSSSSTITSKCSSEEIAEKRRLAMERLKNRNKLKKK